MPANHSASASTFSVEAETVASTPASTSSVSPRSSPRSPALGITITEPAPPSSPFVVIPPTPVGPNFVIADGSATTASSSESLAPTAPQKYVYPPAPRRPQTAAREVSDYSWRASGASGASGLSGLNGRLGTSGLVSPTQSLSPHHQHNGSTGSGKFMASMLEKMRNGYPDDETEQHGMPSLKSTRTGSNAPSLYSGFSMHGTNSRNPREPPPPKLMKSTLLTTEIYKPWLKEKDTTLAIAYYLTYFMIFLGFAGAGAKCFFAWNSVQLITQPMCIVLDDNFDTLNSDVWAHEVNLGGFGNGDFEMTTDSSNNSFIKDGMLYIMPTLTSDVIGTDAIFNGHTYNLTGCTSANSTSCGAVSNATLGSVINPVMSARLTTKNSTSIRFGRVEIRAKNPTGDWLWPSLWMSPKDSVYGAWPMSGEIDIMQSRGNTAHYKAQGNNVVRSSLQWGPTTFINSVWRTYGWYAQRRSTYSGGFHTYVLEWTPHWMRVYVDDRLQSMFHITFNEPFFKRGKYPSVVVNGTEQIVLQNPWAENTTVPNAAPFDQEFFLNLAVSAGSTNGWFPDRVGNKPWLDESPLAPYQFAHAQDEWYQTWPQGDNVLDRALVIDHVKMWRFC